MLPGVVKDGSTVNGLSETESLVVGVSRLVISVLDYPYPYLNAEKEWRKYSYSFRHIKQKENQSREVRVTVKEKSWGVVPDGPNDTVRGLVGDGGKSRRGRSREKTSSCKKDTEVLFYC